ncbi:MAG: TonB-dependent receptor [Bacteroidales bacterium]|nr:TonB-dependent receptor [Bacteroidales bacterium]
MKVLQTLLFAALILFSFPEKLPASDFPIVKYTISGYVKDASNGEALIGSTVLVKEEGRGTATNIYGFYSISLAPGTYTLVYSFIGYNPQEQVVRLTENQVVNIELNLESKILQEVVVRGEKLNSNIVKPEMSVSKLEMKSIQRIPALMGEVDVIKAIQMLPGVQPTAEGSSGFSVRGGGIDQNLILLDEATVYNASHLMGFFSVFNNDAIRDVKLYKGDIPANYGGRLSSVLDVRMKEGNNKKLSATGGIGLISSRLTLEGPIGSEKTSFLISGRRTYADLFFPLLTDTNAKKAVMYFYDLNLKINHQINNNNRLYLSAYLGRDHFGQKGSSDVGFGNRTFTLRWNHLISPQLFSNTTAIISKYDYSLKINQGSSKYFWKSSLLDYTLKLDFNYFLTPENEFKFGVSSTYHDINPCNAWIEGNDSTLTVPYPKNYELEHVAYISNQQKIGDNLTLKYGVRFTVFQNIGKTYSYKFDQNYNVIDTINYASGKIFHTYHAFDPRLGIIYTIDSKSSVKASYSHTTQFMQLASNSNGGMPLDIWFPSTPNIKPQKADQYALGYFRNFFDNNIETSVEAYYKDMNNVIDFKDHATLIMNPRMEGDVRTGTAKAYGIEFSVKKNEGKLTGWVSYTLSKVKRKIPEISDKAYPAPYDKPNNINIILSYEFTKRLMISANWIYATGTPMTAPVGTFEFGNTVNKIYSSRNGYRMRDYHRLDLSVTLKGLERPNRFWHGEWVFSIYNAYGRHNDWIINFIQDKNNPQVLNAQRTYLPFEFFPSVTYNFNF